MGKKTRKISKRHRKTHKRRQKGTHRLYRKRRDILTLPGSKGIPLFSAPIHNKPNKIMVNSKRESGNMIQGLRNM